jgi:hypothetical protein
MDITRLARDEFTCWVEDANKPRLGYGGGWSVRWVGSRQGPRRPSLLGWRLPVPGVPSGDWLREPGSCGRYCLCVRLAVRIVAFGVALAGIFWTGRESSHGLHALWEHWWCPLPLAGIVIGAVLVVLLRERPTPTI